MESVEFFQFHGIRPWNSFSSMESVEIGGIWWHISMESRGIFTSLPAPPYCHHFSRIPWHLLRNSVRILHGSIPRNSTMIPWHIYRRECTIILLCYKTFVVLPARAAMFTRVNGTVSCFFNKRLQNWPTFYKNFTT